MSFRNSAHTRINRIIPLNDLYIEKSPTSTYLVLLWNIVTF